MTKKGVMLGEAEKGDARKDKVGDADLRSIDTRSAKRSDRRCGELNWGAEAGVFHEVEKYW